VANDETQRDVMLRGMDTNLIQQAKSRAALEDKTLRDWVMEAIRKALRAPAVERRVGRG